MCSFRRKPSSHAFLQPFLPSPPRRRRRPALCCTALPPWRGHHRPSLREFRVGSVVVPRHLWDLRMRQKGIYRSVEYVVERLTLDNEDIPSIQAADPLRHHDVVATLRPVNRLLPRFEREWPVSVKVHDACLFSYTADLLSCALVTLAVSAAFLGVGAFGPQFVSIYSIPSSSMYPTLHIGDALLVEKISIHSTAPHRGEIVLFRPPERLLRIIRSSHEDAATASVMTTTGLNLKRKTLFVKRVVAVGGDIIEVRGKDVRVNGVKIDEAAPGSPNVAPRKIPDGFLFVIGDNARRSIDSRYWGLLPVDYVVGRPVARIFPLDRFDINV